jgi:hypothetical protein
MAASADGRGRHEMRREVMTGSEDRDDAAPQRAQRGVEVVGVVECRIAGYLAGRRQRAHLRARHLPQARISA